MKKGLIITTVSGFVPQFEMNHVYILQEMGYEIHYASNFHNPQYGSDNHRLYGTGIICHQIDFVRSPFPIVANIKALRQLLALLQEHRFDLIHCHTPMGGVLGRLAAQCYKKRVRKKEQNKQLGNAMKVIYTAHGFHFYHGAALRNWLFYYPVERWLARYTDLLITINEEDYKRAKAFYWQNWMGKQGMAAKINGVGVDVTYYKNDSYSVEEKEAIRRKLKMKKGQLLFLSVGELNGNKNHKVILQALAERKADICYAICGKGCYQKRLQRWIKKYGLEDQVKLLGYRADILKLLKASDVFVLPSLREGLPLSLQEAMACGLPVMASDIRGNRELVDQEKGGWLVNPNDWREWKNVIQSVHLADLDRMGTYNQEKIKNYDKSIVVKQMKALYHSILTE